jgi:hypothetical protein
MTLSEKLDCQRQLLQQMQQLPLMVKQSLLGLWIEMESKNFSARLIVNLSSEK